MALLGTRGGQGMYLAYTAGQMPELAPPTGLASFIQFNAPKPKAKGDKEEESTKDSSFIFTGTEGSRRAAQELNNVIKYQYESSKNGLIGLAKEYMSNGHGIDEMLKDPEALKLLQVNQQAIGLQEDLYRIRSYSNEDLRNIDEATARLQEAGTQNRTALIATQNGMYIPVGMNWDEYMKHEQTRQDKLRMGEDGRIDFQGSKVEGLNFNTTNYLIIIS